MRVVFTGMGIRWQRRGKALSWQRERWEHRTESLVVMREEPECLEQEGHMCGEVTGTRSHGRVPPHARAGQAPTGLRVLSGLRLEQDFRGEETSSRSLWSPCRVSPQPPGVTYPAGSLQPSFPLRHCGDARRQKERCPRSR